MPEYLAIIALASPWYYQIEKYAPVGKPIEGGLRVRYE